jgi:glucokinase
MFLGIEIGGTKLQFGVGKADGGPFVAMERLNVVPKNGAEGIRNQIEDVARRLIAAHDVEAVGLGFGGPIDAAAGRILVSNQIEGWKDFPIVAWATERLGLPAVLANDSDCGGLAEALFGAGKGSRVVFYNNIGSGIGGAFVIDGRLYAGGNGIAAEFGHLRPGPLAERPDQDIESMASGWAITRAVRSRLESPASASPCCGPSSSQRGNGGSCEPWGASAQDRSDLLARCENQLDRLNTKIIAEAALAGNRVAMEVFDRAVQTIGWGLAQVITLLTPNVIVMGGGVSLVDDSLLLTPLRQYVQRYVFPPLDGCCRIERAKLGEEMVVHGVLAVTANAFPFR